MTTQAQGKGKKKNKEVMKVSLDEFNQIDAPHGHSVVSLKMTGLDWAETMADYDQQSSETQQIIVPAAPRAQRGPGVDFDTLPNEPPFRVSLFNLPMSVEDKEISDRFFQNLNVIRVDISSKANTTVELVSKNDLYDALCKDGTNFKGRIVSVCLYGESPQSSYGLDRYGSRGGNSYEGRYGDRNQGGFSGQRSGDKYGERSSGFNRDRDSYSGFSRGGFGQQRSGYGERYNDRSNFRENNRSQYTSGGGEPESEEPENWRARPTVKVPTPSASSSYNNGSRQPYVHSTEHQQPSPASAPSHHQQYHHSEPYYQSRYQHHHNQPPNNSPYSQFSNQAISNNKPLPSSSAEERPKLVLSKRSTPLTNDDVSVNRNEAIFGQAKPTSTPYLKMNEVEEKLKAVQIVDKKEVKLPSQAGSQVGFQPGSAPRMRKVSSNHSESNS